jgi:chromosome segregation ATPase
MSSNSDINKSNVWFDTLQFHDVMTGMYVLWERLEKEKKVLQDELSKANDHIKEITTNKNMLQNENNKLQTKVSEITIKTDDLIRKVNEAEDEHKQFRKVSHIITMEKENTNLKQQINILERRVTFYQNQCSKNAIITEDKSTYTDIDNHVQCNVLLNITSDNDDTIITSETTSMDNIIESLKDAQYDDKDDVITAKESDMINIHTDQHIISDIKTIKSQEATDDNEDSDINVIEKKIKGVIYYVSDEGDIYEKNDDDSIGNLKGKIENLPNGKTKVKWYKS